MQQNNNKKESVRKFSATPDDSSSNVNNKPQGIRRHNNSQPGRRPNRGPARPTQARPAQDGPNRRSGNFNRQTSTSSQTKSRGPRGMHFSSDDTEIPEFDQKPKKLPEIQDGNIRIITLGGVEEIGKNMTAIETKNDIIVVDAGFAFPGDEAPGVDYIIPDTTYLEERKHKIRGLVVTHAHLDHIGGIPYIMSKIGNPPIYTSLLTAVMIKKRQEEFVHLPPLNLNVVNQKETIKLGESKIRFFAATHTIPDSVGVIIETIYGNIVVTGDIKIDHRDGTPEKNEVETFSQIGKEKNLVLIAESTNIERPGFSPSEREVQASIKNIIANIKGRIIVSTFASLFERLIAIIEAAEELNKKIVIEGRSMKTNIEIAKELGLLKVKRDTLISSDDIDDYPDNRIVVLATGAQGDEFAALMRIAQREHKKVVIKKGDTVMLSSSVIPGNEKAVQKLKDNLARQGAKILHYGVANVHSSGHSYAGELAWIHKMIRPKFFIPVHGNHFNLHLHADMATELGMPEKNTIIPDNGSIMEISDKGNKFTSLKDKAPSKLVMVDGIGSNNVQEVVIRDRQMLSQDGMFVIIAIVDMSTGKIRKSPDIISRGFVYLKESQDLLRHARILIKKKIEDATAQMHPINLDYVKNIVREEMGKFLFQKTHKRPIILPVLIEV